MASWVTHLIIADRLLAAFPALDRQGFRVGNIAPDCNLENADFTDFIPSRETTHWMSVKNDKLTADCEGFYRAYIEERKGAISSSEEYAFLLGYYAAAWRRALAIPALAEKARGLTPSWPAVKALIPKEERMKDVYAIEAEYLAAHPDSGYLTDILPLRSFPDYIDYLPEGAMVRKIGVMGYLPKAEESAFPFVAVSREEYAAYIDAAAARVSDRISPNLR